MIYQIQLAVFNDSDTKENPEPLQTFQVTKETLFLLPEIMRYIEKGVHEDIKRPKMHDSMFKPLSQEETDAMAVWADDPVNQTETHWNKRGIYHPAVREQWEKNGFALNMRMMAVGRGEFTKG